MRQNVHLAIHSFVKVSCFCLPCYLRFGNSNLNNYLKGNMIFSFSSVFFFDNNLKCLSLDFHEYSFQFWTDESSVSLWVWVCLQYPKFYTFWQAIHARMPTNRNWRSVNKTTWNIWQFGMNWKGNNSENHFASMIFTFASQQFRWAKNIQIFNHYWNEVYYCAITISIVKHLAKLNVHL